MSLPQLRDATLSLNDAVATLSFDRDDVRNELTGTGLVQDIIDTCEWVNSNHDVAVLIITGNGKAFSAGGNINHMHEKTGMFGGDPMQIQNGYRRGIQQMSLAMYRLEVPAIAAINGAAVGAGFDLTCMCDIRLACEHTKVGETFVNLGIIPGDGGAWFLPRVVGMQRAADMVFSGRIVGADEGLAMGLFMEVVSSDSLLPRAEELATQYAQKPREALRLCKRLLAAGQRQPLPDFLDYTASLQSLCHHSQDHADAVAGFLKNK
jgi:enoyl-CoA hydratase/carnithine racemase